MEFPNAVQITNQPCVLLIAVSRNVVSVSQKGKGKISTLNRLLAYLKWINFDFSMNLKCITTLFDIFIKQIKCLYSIDRGVQSTIDWDSNRYRSHIFIEFWSCQHQFFKEWNRKLNKKHFKTFNNRISWYKSWLMNEKWTLLRML